MTLALARAALIGGALLYLAHLGLEAAEGAARWRAMPAETIATGGR